MIEILRIVSTFGVKGAVRVVLYTENLNQYKKLYDPNGREYGFRISHAKGNTVVLFLDDVTDCNSAEKLVGISLFVKKTDVPPTKKNQFYIFNLIGKKIKVADSKTELQIIDVKNFGAGDLLELSEEQQESFFIPFTEENFPEIDGTMFVSQKAYRDFQN